MTSQYGSSAFSRVQSYAPTPYSYIPQSALNATISVDQEISLPSNAAERDLLDSLAELYSIIVTLDDLEKAFNKGSVTAAEYTDICRRSINSYQNILRDEKVAREFGSIESFKREWNVSVPGYKDLLEPSLVMMSAHSLKHPCKRINIFIYNQEPETSLEMYKVRNLCACVPISMKLLKLRKEESAIGARLTTANLQIEVPRATERLRVMVPATIELTSGPSISKEEKAETSNERVSMPSVQETVTATENFITFLDAVKLGMVSKDQLHPLLSDVITSANNVTKTDFDGRANIIKWLIKLNQMRATDELDDDQKREIEFDIGAAYNGFKQALSG